MNDRFKFRIYCKSEKKMMLFNNPSLIDGDIFKGGLLFKNYDHKITNVHEVSPNDLILMQSTGLKDKNGKLIYEGDIVKNWDKREYEIIWCYEAACFLVQNVTTKCKQGIYSLVSLSNDLEVIGNIYESEIPDGRSETSPDSEQMEQTGAKPRQRHSVSVEEFQDNRELLDEHN